VDDGEIKVIDCPTEEMWADVLTKPLEGMAFRKMQAKLMNCEMNYEEHDKNKTCAESSLLTARGMPALPSQTPQECAGQNRSNALK
jgi:hypothetical protein